MIEWIAYAAVVLGTPALAFAGWRLGLRGRGGGFLSEPPSKTIKKIPYTPGEVRPRVRSARYDREKRR